MIACIEKNQSKRVEENCLVMELKLESEPLVYWPSSVTVVFALTLIGMECIPYFYQKYIN